MKKKVSMDDPYVKLRDLMVKEQIEKRGIHNPRILSTLRVVPRHLFVNKDDWERAYRDQAMEIGYEATISQPYIVAIMTDMLQLRGVEKVLEVGTGSGYQTAILAELAGEVYSLEIIPQLSEKAGKILDTLGYKNVHLKVGEGSKGWPEHAPYAAIMVTAAPASVPTALFDQLQEGGRLVIPLGKTRQNLYVFNKSNGKIHEEKKFEVRFVPLIEGH